jgi:hypothetical protein
MFKKYKILIQMQISSTGLKQSYTNKTITIPFIIHRPVIYSKHDILENEFCLSSEKFSPI